VFVALATRQLMLIDRDAVNVLFWDQWAAYAPFFHHASWWGMFDYQTGPHRLGAGALVQGTVAGASGWNSRYDSFEVSLFTIAAAILALRLARLFDD
jgi:hypothetical protein